jgi:signal peptidase I
MPAVLPTGRASEAVEMMNRARRSILRGATSGLRQLTSGLTVGLLAVGLVSACVNVTVVAPASTPTPSPPQIGCDSLSNGAFIYRVVQTSMEPTVEPGDEVLTVPGATYARGNIVVFTPPPAWLAGTAAPPFIKRVIGLPGDTVEVRDGGVWVNGTKLDEPYLFENQPTTAQSEPATWTVGAGQLFVLGDHRAGSADSRSFGTIAASTVLGVAVRRCSPSETPLQ